MTTPQATAETIKREWTKQQLDALRAALNTVLGKLSDKDAEQLIHDNKHLPALQAKSLADADASNLSEEGSDWSVFEECLSYIARTVNAQKRQELSKLLGLLSSGATMGILSQGSHWSPFASLSNREREQLILRWQNSRLATLRAIARTLVSLTIMATYNRPEAQALHSAIGFPSHDPVRSGDDYVPPGGYPERLTMWSTEQALNAQGNRFDAIVIGSGAGGGVAAATLAEAGKSVLVIEKGPYVHESEFELNEAKGISRLYEKQCIFPSDRGNLTYMAGSLFGGSTTVNWSATLKPQHFVREQWAREGLEYYLTQQFTDDLETVCQRIGASTSGIQHNKLNQILLDGCQNLGYHFDNIPQNTSGKTHQCNYCFVGCKDGIKNSTMNTWLRDAKANGAQFLDNTRVLRVLIKKGKAVGVECLVHNSQTKVSYFADRVVVSAGSLHSPGVLKRSGLTNKNIGNNMRVHPVATVFGKFKEPLDGFNGPIMTAISFAKENVDGDYFGAKLEVAALHPGFFGAMLPWRGAKAHKDIMLNYRYYSPIIVLTRDKDSKASVTHNPVTGEVIGDFEISKHDAHSMLEGMAAALRVLVAAGARELQTTNPRHPVFSFAPDEPSDVTNPRFLAFLETIRRVGVPDVMATAHIMGSCRMGVTPKTSVVKPTGETYEVKNLYVCDASVFPSATGVNPMVSTEAVSLGIARHVVRSFTPASKL
ncbi:long-chain fatty alcohol dehydrogenase [Hesseltinella vesiculosa]|uniref:Long-chain-alcohol oxidase n=1 Tax=Hesseltinella vesiculosa TaxID=101127 RepID=A0A1X2GL01_9FUNG|nr:long-chain fatty alcohol dehydrogenase [Hesseltinella vesiculosa]